MVAKTLLAAIRVHFIETAKESEGAKAMAKIEDNLGRSCSSHFNYHPLQIMQNETQLKTAVKMPHTVVPD